MNYNEIRAESLRIMFSGAEIDVEVNGEENGSRVGLSLLENDENIGSFLKNMRGSINRCFSLIEAKGVLPDRTVSLDVTCDGAIGSAELPDDCYSPIKIAMHSGYSARANVTWRREGNEILIYDCDPEAIYVLIYKPRIKRLKKGLDDFCEIDLPENIAEHIPYFIKGDLFREDEPSEAAEARNWFEAAMSELSFSREGEQRSVETLYGGMMS